MIDFGTIAWTASPQLSERQSQDNRGTSTVCGEFASFVPQVQLAVRDIEKSSSCNNTLYRTGVIGMIHFQDFDAGDPLALRVKPDAKYSLGFYSDLDCDEPASHARQAV